MVTTVILHISLLNLLKFSELFSNFCIITMKINYGSPEFKLGLSKDCSKENEWAGHK
jgi:hypothetical protein